MRFIKNIKILCNLIRISHKTEKLHQDKFFKVKNIIDWLEKKSKLLIESIELEIKNYDELEYKNNIIFFKVSNPTSYVKYSFLRLEHVITVLIIS